MIKIEMIHSLIFLKSENPRSEKNLTDEKKKEKVTKINTRIKNRHRSWERDGDRCLSSHIISSHSFLLHVLLKPRFQKFLQLCNWRQLV